jgi:tetratricopeptide (TPR) repeat protein
MSQVLILQGKVYTAKKLLERAKDKSGWRYNCLRALAAKIAGEGDDAVDSWLKNGAEAADAPAFAHYQYAAFLLGRAKLDDAMKWAKKALEGGYDSADGFRLIARIYCAKGDIKTAERYLLYSLSSSPQDANTLCMLAEVAVMKRRYSDALKYLTDGLAANPEHLDSLKSCAYIYYLLNRFADARGYLDKASAIAPNDPYVLRLNKALSEIQNLLCWRDLFRRADSIDVANGWSEEGEQLGVEIKIKDGNLVMEGTQKDNGDVLLTRAENLKGFVRLEAMLDFTGALETNCGLKILVRDAKGNLQSWINFIKDANGKLRYNYSSTGALDGELKDAPDLGVCPNKAKLGIELADQKSSLWRFYLDGEFVGEVKAEGVLKRAGSGANIFVGVYGRAAPVKQWSLSCDYVYVFRRKSGE